LYRIYFKKAQSYQPCIDCTHRCEENSADAGKVHHQTVLAERYIDNRHHCISMVK